MAIITTGTGTMDMATTGMVTGIHLAVRAGSGQFGFVGVIGTTKKRGVASGHPFQFHDRCV
jgi:hypothetical protein